MKLGPKEFTFLQRLVHKHSGLSLAENKTYLFESRLLPLLRKYELEDFAALVQRLKKKNEAALITAIVEAMMTHETSFFRDRRPFDVLYQKIIPDLLASASRKLRIWSTACSSGQEPYSIAMTLLDHSECLGGLPYEIIATDLDHGILEKARAGVYSQFEVQRGLPITHLVKYFHQYDGMWKLRKEVKTRVTFKDINLLEDCQHLGKFDIIFCRNALIYFDDATKAKVFETLARNLNPGGVVILGSAETPHGIDERYTAYKQYPGIFTIKR